MPTACEHTRFLSSVALDEQLRPADRDAIDAHIETCDACQAFAADLAGLRQRLRFEALDRVPDVAPRVRAALEADRSARLWRFRRGTPRPPRRAARHPRSLRLPRPQTAVLARAAAVFVAAFAAGALVAGLTVPSPVLAATLGERILQAQSSLQALSAQVEVVERGWHFEVPVRTYEGELLYRGPEQLGLHLRDTTRYPSSAWVRNDVVLVVDEDVARTRGHPTCPAAAQPDCADPEPRTRVIRNREPFDLSAPVPLDLVLPVRSFAVGGEVEVLGERRIDGHETIGVAVTVAQVAPMLDGILGVGDWRELHPADRVELWLDRESFVPLQLLVRASDTFERRRWAAARAPNDRAGAVLLEVRLRNVRLNADVGEFEFGRPEAEGGRDGRFVAQEPGAVDAPTPSWLPEGLEPHRAGTADGVGVRTWADGRAWMKLRATRDWAGGRLFGDLGPVVRRVALGEGASVAYVGEGGSAVAVHADEVDVVLTGSVPEEDLLRVAGSLGLVGRRVPADWVEGRTTSLVEARRTLGSLLVPQDLDGFDGPAVQVTGDTAALAYVGGGARAFLLVQSPGEVLAPPMDDAVLGVAMRGTTARYTPERGELEWVEDGRLVSLRSRTLALGELLAIAESLEVER